MDNQNSEQAGKNERLEQLRLQCTSLRKEARNAYVSRDMITWAGKTVQSHAVLRQIRVEETVAVAAAA